MAGCVAISAMAAVVAAMGTDAVPARLAALLRGVAPISYVVAFGYHGAGRPLALYDDFPADKWRIFVGQYLAGPYVLDPFYLACDGREPAGLHRIKDLAPDRFYQGEYFRNYYVQTGLAEELGYFITLQPGVTVVLSLMRAERRFSRHEFRALAEVYPLVAATIRQHWSGLPQRLAARQTRSPPDGSFADFGLATLTAREREVVEYTLKGHSAEATGLIMAIAPGTVRIHRRNIYAKLGISSQGELFARFFSALAPN